MKLKAPIVNTLEETKIYIQELYRNIINKVNDPCFSAYNSATDLNVTGDGTVHTVVFNSKIFDQGANYDNATGIFTASVDGLYLFNTQVKISGMVSTNTKANLNLVTTKRTYYVCNINPYVSADSTGYLALPATIITNMDRGDTIYVGLYAIDTYKVIDVYGSSDGDTYFSGYLIQEI
jgi:hypothetical protein